MATTIKWFLFGIMTIHVFWIVNGHSQKCIQGQNCKLPDCFCSTFQHPVFNVSDIPQMVYFGFDDALTPLVDPIYKKLFRQDRTNPNGCPIGMTLFVSDQYTSYAEVKFFYDRGMEIASHSVHHGHIKTEKSLYEEAKLQKQNLARRGRIPESDIIGWRSPFLETAGDYQPQVLHKLGYKYDVSLTYRRGQMREPNPWPFTADYGWPFRCQMKPCLSYSHPGFWEFPVNSMFDYKNQFPCNYVDGCYNRPENEHEAFKYLMDNFNNAYEGNRAPLGIHMHASWLLTKHNFKAMDKFIQDILKLSDVFIIPVKSVLEWMKSPTRISDIRNFNAWQCGNYYEPVNSVTPSPSPKSKSKSVHITTTQRRSTTVPTRLSTTTVPTTVATTTVPTTVSTTTIPTTVSTTTLPATVSTTPITHFKTKITTSKSRPVSYNNVPNSELTQNRIHVESETKNQDVDATTAKVVPLFHSSVFQPNQAYQNKTSSATNANNSHYNQTMSKSKRQTTSVETFFRLTTKKSHIKPATSSATTNNFNWSWVFGGLFQQKPLTANSGILHGVDIKDKCTQDLNCKLPHCFCEGSAIPDLHIRDTPQFVYISFDGDINARVFSHYRSIFSGKRKNPNMCPISSTFFISQKRSMEGYISYLNKKGQEIAIRGSLSNHITNMNQLHRDIFAKRGALSRIGVPVYGLRSPDLKPLGDDQFSALVQQGVEYDASLVLSNSVDGKIWPFTLDFGWKDKCVIPNCPKKNYPGLWEVPNIPITDYKNMYPCNYVDGCMYSPRTAEETFRFLWDNFERFYRYNKAPFGINFRQVWFTHLAYRNNVRGFEMFLDKLGQMSDVYVVSTEKLIKWMKQPVPLSEMPFKFHC